MVIYEFILSGGIKRYTENFYRNTNKKELNRWIVCFIYINKFCDHPPACHLSNPACFYQLCFHERLINLGIRWRCLLAFDHYVLALILRIHLFRETPCILCFFICILALGFLGRNGGLLCSFSVCSWSKNGGLAADKDLTRVTYVFDTSTLFYCTGLYLKLALKTTQKYQLVQNSATHILCRNELLSP